MNWERLSSQHKILVTKEHTFNTDTILLADFSMPQNNSICADFGTGCGTIAILWAIRRKPKKIFAVEIQKKAYNQALTSVTENKLENIEVINADLKNYKSLFKCGSLDQVVCNPPYKAQGTGIKNTNKNMSIARHEEELDLNDLAKATAYCLKFGGKFFMCQRPERLTDAMNIFRSNGLEAKRLRLVQQRKEKAPSLFLIEFRRGGKSGLEILPTLFITENGEYTKEMLEIYGDYRES